MIEFRHGLVLVTDVSGEIRDVLHNDFDVEVRVGDSFLVLAHSASADKAAHFLQTMQESGAAFNWQFDLEKNGVAVTLHFAGGKQKDQFMIVGAPSLGQATRHFQDFSSIHNEQATYIRQLAKEKSVATGSTIHDELYEEFSRLNNELSTTQRELAKKNAELERLNAVKNRFLGIVAHDLRNPISIIRSYSQYLLDEAASRHTEDEVRIINTVLRSSDFMLALVNDLLDLVKIESGRLDLDLQPMQIGVALERNIELQQSLANKKQQTIHLHMDPAFPVMLLDVFKMEQVFNNLIGNAIKYSPIGGAIEVTLKADDKQLFLTVRDNGPGIAPEFLNKIFEPFAIAGVVSPSGGEKSTGLGLAIVRRIIEGHDGTLSVESVLGSGSTFSVRLPIRSPEAKD